MYSPIFYFSKLNLWDKSTIIIYLIISFILFIFFQNVEQNNKMEIIVYYPLITQILLYIINYKSLRNLVVYFIWIVISLIHLLIFYILKNEGYLISNELRNTFFLLLIYQGLRFLNIKFQKQELICPERGNSKDSFDNRKANIIDYASMILYFGMMIFLLK
jgi:hypothetical protein